MAKSLREIRQEARGVPVREFHDGTFRVLLAWVEPGPFPRWHARKARKLRREWPALADALDQLADTVRQSKP